MAPDIEELISKVNTLTLDKNRLKQKLNQLVSQGSGIGQKHSNILSNQTSSSLQILQQSRQTSLDLIDVSPTLSQPATSGLGGNSNGNLKPDTLKRSLANFSSQSSGTTTTIVSPSCPSTEQNKSNVIAGVECSTSCEDDLLYMNNLYKKRLDEYDDKWDFIQSKCTALLSELDSLQKQYTIMKRENSEWEERFQKKCDDYDSVKGELQTVVLNYETQLSAMSEHLSMITQNR